MSSTMPFWRMEIWHSFEDFFQTKPFQSYKNNNNNNTPFFPLKSHILFMNIRSRKGKKCHSQTENWCKHKKRIHGSITCGMTVLVKTEKFRKEIEKKKPEKFVWNPNVGQVDSFFALNNFRIKVKWANRTNLDHTIKQHLVDIIRI